MRTTDLPVKPASDRPNLSAFSALALDAATELDGRIKHVPAAEPTRALVRHAYTVSRSKNGSALKPTHALAQELRTIFPGERPKLPPETIGLVCGVVETWADASSGGSYKHSSQAALKIADLLEAPELSKSQTRRLLKFCLSLYYATQPGCLIRDIPEDHEGFLSMS